MGLFGFGKKEKKEKKEDKVLQQDLSQTERPGMVFMMQLLMKEACEMPEKEFMTEIMKKHLGDVDCFCHDDKCAGFAPQKYKIEFEKGSMPPQLMVMGCVEKDGSNIDEIARSQMWNCPESEKILSECKYQVFANDMMAGFLEYKDRADMLMDFLEALMEMFPTCMAVYFHNSGKMFTREDIVNHQIPRESRFIYFAVNVRFFNIQGTNDKLVDSLGMSTLYLPDLQYHFHDMDQNWVVNHAYNMLSYIYDANCPIKSGDTIDGIENGQISQDIQWRCQYENSLIQPSREVLDVCMGKFASGTRD